MLVKRETQLVGGELHFIKTQPIGAEEVRNTTPDRRVSSQQFQITNLGVPKNGTTYLIG